MAYEVKFTDSVNKGFITVEENTPNTETSLVLPGRNLSDYGSYVAENFLHLLENFANANPPRNPVEGQLWYDTSIGVDQLKIYDGSQWVSAGGVKKASITPNESASSIGDLWVDTVNQQLHLYNGNTWVLVGPEFSDGRKSGAKFEVVLDTLNAEQPIIVNYVDNVPVAIISNTEFKPKLAIAGFERIYAGVNIASNKKYYGVAEKAEGLLMQGETVPVPANKFARLDRENRFDRAIRIASNEGLKIGENSAFIVNLTESNAFFTNQLQGGSITLRVNDAGQSKPVLTIRSSEKVGINNVNPLEALDVTGNIHATGTLRVDNIQNDSVIISGGLQVGDNLEIGGNLSVAGQFATKDILPDQNNLRSIGTSLLKFKDVYATTFHGYLDGNISGNANIANTAATLTNARTFRIEGDVRSIDQSTGLPASSSFNGSSNVVFRTEINPDFILEKDEETSILPTDELLISRNGVGLRKVEHETLVRRIPVSAVGPTVPVGAIMPFVGQIAPPGWLFCDGSILTVSPAFQALFNVIGFSFGFVSLNGTATQDPSKFRLPDFRGRFALGNLAMSNSVSSGASPVATPNDVVTTGASLGITGGKQSTLLVADNLPEHEHSLQGDQGTQFYAVSSVAGTTDSNTTALAFNGDVGTGLPLRGLSQTESVVPSVIGQPRDVQEIDIVNPFAAVNYIIYYGVDPYGL